MTKPKKTKSKLFFLCRLHGVNEGRGVACSLITNMGGIQAYTYRDQFNRGEVAAGVEILREALEVAYAGQDPAKEVPSAADLEPKLIQALTLLRAAQMPWVAGVGQGPKGLHSGQQVRRKEKQDQEEQVRAAAREAAKQAPSAPAANQTELLQQMVDSIHKGDSMNYKKHLTDLVQVANRASDLVLQALIDDKGLALTTAQKEAMKRRISSSEIPTTEFQEKAHCTRVRFAASALSWAARGGAPQDQGNEVDMQLDDGA